MRSEVVHSMLDSKEEEAMVSSQASGNGEGHSLAPRLLFLHTAQGILRPASWYGGPLLFSRPRVHVDALMSWTGLCSHWSVSSSPLRDPSASTHTIQMQCLMQRLPIAV